MHSSPRWLQNTPSTSNGAASEALADAGHLGGRDEQEDGGGIDEAADQPGAGDPVHLGPGAGDPERAALGVARRQHGLADQRQAGGGPGVDAALQQLRLDAGVAEPGGDAGARFRAVRGR